MQGTAVDLDAQQLLQPDVRQPDVRPEMVEQRELAGLVRRLEEERIEPEGLGELLCGVRAELAAGIEQPDVDGALSGLDDEEMRRSCSCRGSVID